MFMSEYTAIIERIKEVLKASPRGMTVISLAKELNIGRNSAAKYLDILLVSGQVEMESVGPAKIFYLSERIPASKLLNYSSDLILVLNNDFEIVYVNDPFLDLLGVEREVALGKNMEQLSLSVSTYISVFSRLREIIEDNNFQKDVNITFSENGSHFEFNVVPTTLESGVPGNAFILKDVTYEKRMETSLEKYRILLGELAKHENVNRPPKGENPGFQKSYPEVLYGKHIACQAILASLPDFIFIIARDGTFLDFIGAKDDELLMPPSVFIGKKVAETLPENISGQIMDCIELAFENGQMQSIQYQLQFKEEIRDFEARLVITDQDNIMAIVNNITERKRTEKALEYSESKYRSIFENSIDAMYLHDEKGFLFEVNESACRQTGYSREEMLGSSLVERADSPDYMIEMFNTTMDKGHAIFETAVYPQDDSPLFYEISSSIIYFGEEKRILSICRDLTERKRAEAALLENERKYHSLFQQCNEGIYLHDTEGNILDVNNAAALQSGHTREELLKLNIFDLHLNNFERNSIIQQWKHWLPEQPVSLETQHLGKDGTVYTVEINTGKIILQDEELILAVTRDISERKRYEEEMQRYKQIISSTPDGISLLDKDYKYLIINDAYEHFSGKKKEQIIGLTIAEYLGEEVFNSHFKDNFDRCLNGEVVKCQEWVHYPTIGRRFVHVSYFPFKDKDSKIAGVVANTRDITDYRLAEEALRQSEERFLDLFEKAPLGYQSLDAEGYFLMVNEAWLEMLGYEREEVLGKWFGDFLAPEFVEAFRERFPIFKSKGSIRSEFKMLHKTGEQRFITFQGRIGYNNDGTFKQTHCILEDITERKKAEEDLRKSEEKFRTLFDSLHNGVFIVDLNGQLLEANGAASEQTGYSRDELLQLTLLDINLSDNLSTILSNHSKTLKNGHLRFETALVRKDGSTFPAEINLQPVTFMRKTAIIASVRNITGCMNSNNL